MGVGATYGQRSGIPPSRKPKAAGRRIAIKLTFGVVAAAVLVTTMTAAALGLTHVLAASFAARSDARPALALSEPGSLARIEPARLSAAEQWKIIASLAPPASRQPPRQAADAFAAISPTMQDAPDAEPEVTGSIKVYSLASADSAFRPVLFDPHPLAPPVPRPRPQLAALTPVQSNPFKLDDDPAMRRTAIYDISARTVYMPNGERLEAHSGLGPYMDDPRNVHRRMRGATPPNTYKLVLREALFHGVQAIRMKPENEDKMFGRDGILAHSYMLGPNGQSNGCVSFKDYPKFLRAFLRGEVDRMIVVPRLDKPPTAVARRETRRASVF